LAGDATVRVQHMQMLDNYRGSGVYCM
jgi:hypothetical protein